MSERPTYGELKQKVKELEKERIERKRAEENLRSEKDKLKALMDGLARTQIGIDIVGTDYIILFQNQALKERFGNRIGKVCYESYMGLKKPCDSCPMIESIRSNKVESVELTGADGRSYELFSAPIPNQDGTVDKAIEVVSDITAQKQTKDSLEKSERRYRDLIENSFDGIFVQKGPKIIFTNQRLNEMLGYEKNELVGIDHWLVYHPDYRELARERAKARMRGDMVNSQYEVKLQRKDGSWLYGEINTRPISFKEGPGVQVWVRDIMERKQTEDTLKESEEKYRTILENIDEGYFEVDLTGTLTFCNEALCKITGFTRGESLGMNNREYTTQETAQKMYETFNYVYRTGKTLRVIDYEIIVKDGRRMVIEMSTSLMRDPSGAPIGFRGVIRDITSRKQAEDDLKESEEKYRSVLENMEEGYYEVDIAGNFTFVNDSMSKILGYSEKELIGMNNRQYMDKANEKKVYRIFNRVYTTGKPDKGIDWEFLRKEGTTRYVETSTSLIKDKDGNKIGFRGILRDITDRKKAEEELKTRQIYLESVLYNAPDAIVTLDAAHHILEWNPGAEQIFDYTSNEVVGKNLDDLVSGPDVIDEAKEITAQILSGAKMSPRETVRYRKDGTPVNVIAAGSPIIIRDELQGVVAVYTDITELKQAEEALKESEERFRVLVEESPLGVFLIDKDGYYKYINPKFIEMFGYTLKDIPTGREWFKKAYPDQEYRNSVISAWMSDINDSEVGEHRPITFRVKCKDGTEKIIEFRAVIMEAGDQFVICEDITEQQNLEIQLQQAQKMEAIGTLAGGIAHNFNNLLMSIQGNTSLMLLDITNDHAHYERLTNIEKLVQSGSKLTSQLLGYARGGRYEVKPISINRIIQETSATFAMTRKDITLHHDLEHTLSGVKADRGQIEQVILNIYVNAAEAMAGGGELFISTRNILHTEIGKKPYTVKPGHYILVTIRDTGIGMDKATKEKVFDPFFTTKGLAKGTGLGLASAYGIMKAHAGYIDVASQKGKGATFFLYLPASTETIGEEVQLAGTIEKGKETILFVDDEEIILDVGEELLTSLGYTVLIAHGGKEAIETLHSTFPSSPPDLVILDMIMPQMGGGETYDRLKELFPSIKVLLSSGYSIDGQAKEILERGCNGFIQKPFTLREISKAIREVLGKK